MIKIPEIGQERLFTLVVKATVIDKSDAHGACVELAIEQRDFATYEHRTVWLDADEISEVTSDDITTTQDRRYDGVGALVRALALYEPRGDHKGMERCISKALELLAPDIAAEIATDGAARIYAERWEGGGREDHVPDGQVDERAAMSHLKREKPRRG